MLLPKMIDKKQEKEQILANLSHELKTPLINLLGGLEQLERNALLPEQRYNVSTMEENIWHLMHMVDKVLTLARIKNKSCAVNPGNCSLKVILQKVVPGLVTQAAQKGVSLHVQVEDTVPDLIYLDGQILQDLLFHLLDNAVKFTAHGKINLLIGEAGGQLKVHVTDTGIGITPAVGERLFECYYQADISFSRKYAGIGGGLYICRKLLELVNGRIWWEPLPYKGSCLVFEIPYQLAKADITEPTAAPAHPTVFLKAPRLLLVEDHVENQYLIRDMLESYGFEVILAEHGLEAINLLQKMHIDLVLMDMQMPIMDGYEATTLIRECQDWANLPIVAVTAHNNPGDRVRCLAAGCNQYIAKPFKIEELIDSICTLLHTAVPAQSSASGDGLVEMLMPQFIAGLQKNLEELGQAYTEGNYASIQKIGHAIKGTAGLYKQSYIALLGKKIEQNAKSQDLLLPQMLQILKNACLDLEKNYTLHAQRENVSNL